MSARHPGTYRLFGRRRFPGHTLRDTLTAYAFVGSSAIIIAVFGLFPVLFTVYVSLFRWRLARGRFSGFDNYVALFGGNPAPLAALAAAAAGLVLAAVLLRAGRTAGSRGGTWAGVVLLAASLAAAAAFLPMLAAQGDREVFDALRVTIWYCICTVPPQMAAGLLLALLLTRRMRGKQTFRVISLLPYIAPTVATAAIFELLFSLRPDSFANQVVGLFGARTTAVAAGAPWRGGPCPRHRVDRTDSERGRLVLGRVDAGPQSRPRLDRLLQLVGVRGVLRADLHDRSRGHSTPDLRSRGGGRCRPRPPLLFHHPARCCPRRHTSFPCWASSGRSRRSHTCTSCAAPPRPGRWTRSA